MELVIEEKAEQASRQPKNAEAHTISCANGAMPWYKVTLSADEISAGRDRALINAFSQRLSFSGTPPDAALCKELGTAAVYYFSPSAANLMAPFIVLHAGVECAAPKRSDVTISGGPQDTREVLFAPETRR
jgi:hypothetical protein